MKVLFLSHTNWNSIFKVGSHQLANAYINMGIEVYYISNPFSFFHLKGLLSNDKNFKERIKRLKPYKKNNFFEWVPPILVPFTNKPFFKKANHAIRGTLIDKFILNYYKNKYRIDNFDLVLIDSPKLAYMLRYINYKKVYYRITDFYVNMSDKPFREIEEVEKFLIKKVDKVICTSLPLKQYYEKKYKISTILIENGVDINNFEKQTFFPKEYKGIDKKIIYVGSLDKRFNWEFVTYAALKNKNIDFFIIGPTNMKFKISNLHILGQKKYTEISSYLRYADVGIMPFIISKENNGRSPMKMYEYGISGLPVVASFTEEIARRNLDYVFLVKNKEEFSDQIKNLIGCNGINKIKDNAIKEAKKHSWKNIAEYILKL